MTKKRISIRGARQHNLKNIDLDIPRDRFVVVTGISGSGKSTLAFDTLYAEGQRRYVESLSTYARQFLERLDKPDVDLIEGLSPAIAIEQRSAGHNPRSTVGTVTEIYDYLRLLYARVGIPYCYSCGDPIRAQSIDQVIDRLHRLPEGSRILVMAPLIDRKKGTHRKLMQDLVKQGFARVMIDGQVHELPNVGTLNKNERHSIDVVVDRLILKPSALKRMADSIELALAQSGGRVAIAVLGGKTLQFNERAICTRCGISYPDLSPASFSFNSPQGACRKCNGLGSTSEFDPALIIPNPTLSLREGAVAIWAHRNSVYFAEFLDALTAHYGVDIYTPFQDLPERFKQMLLHGSGDTEINFYVERGERRTVRPKPFEGLVPILQRRYRETDSHQVREDIKQYMRFLPCPECGGARLRRSSRAVKIDDRTIQDTTALTIRNARIFFASLQLDKKRAQIADRIIKEITQRLSFLEDVGLGYLTLDRSANTLSGGESQRIRLATQIGSRLTGVLYVLDEPSIGLHQRDNQRLLDTLFKMRDLGNTVLVVEHDEEAIRQADHVVDMGPGAGLNGGEVVFSGSPTELMQHAESLTGQYLSGRQQISLPDKRRPGQGPALTIEGAAENNLRQISVRLPLGCLIGVTGVSGSGKSTLVLQTLYRALCQRLNNARLSAGKHAAIIGIEQIDKVINIDQSPIGRTPRSNPGTYSGVFTFIRELFARTPDARMRGFKPGRFSFNVKGGRCEACRGDGIVKIEMHFLPDVYVTCDVCRGLRYNRETLDIRYKGRNINEVLAMTVNQSLQFFKNIKTIRPKLTTLAEVGLGYVRLGQPATTLSGGEAQRVKLARELSKRATGGTLYILDEPTTGLHMDDIRKLLRVLNRLVDAGNTVVVIEHHLDVIKAADYIVDLGPEGGDGGGEVVGCGTPEEIAALPGSFTGQYLRRVLSK